MAPERLCISVIDYHDLQSINEAPIMDERLSSGFFRDRKITHENPEMTSLNPMVLRSVIPGFVMAPKLLPEQSGSLKKEKLKLKNWTGVKCGEHLRKNGA